MVQRVKSQPDRSPQRRNDWVLRVIDGIEQLIDKGQLFAAMVKAVSSQRADMVDHDNSQRREIALQQQRQRQPSSDEQKRGAQGI